MALSHQCTEKLAQALNFSKTASSAATPFALATASTVFCLWLRVSELLGSRLNQFIQSKRDECQTSCHEVALRERKKTCGAIEAQAREARSRDGKPATGAKKRCAKWAPTYEQAIGRTLQDDDRAFLVLMKREALILRLPCRKSSAKVVKLAE